MHFDGGHWGGGGGGGGGGKGADTALSAARKTFCPTRVRGRPLPQEENMTVPKRRASVSNGLIFKNHLEPNQKEC